MNKLLLRVPADLDGQRLDKVLAQHPLIGSRSKAAQLIDEGHVLGGSRAKLKTSTPVRADEEYKIDLPPPESPDLEPLDLPLDIVYEDEDLVVINKPAGLVVHPAAGHAQDTLVNALIYHIKDFSMGFGDPRPGIVHRLDKDTSGLLVVAKNDAIQAGLVQQFKDRSVARRYKAIVLGHPAKDEDRIESYFSRHPTQRKKFASVRPGASVTPKGKRALTHYRVLDRHSGGLSLLECRLQTGRTHQIRVHMSELGHPLVGDELYGSPSREGKLRSLKLRGKLRQLQRLGLHAAELGFKHPRTRQELFFKAAWPEDLRDLLEELGWLDVE